MSRAVILFDGVCNFCNGAVNFVIARDPAGYFRFASQQSKAGLGLLGECQIEQGVISTIVLVNDGRYWAKSAAILRIAAQLGPGWRLLAALGRCVPRKLADAAYDAIARRRYKIWGKSESCRVPSPAERTRFLS